MIGELMKRSIYFLFVLISFNLSAVSVSQGIEISTSVLRAPVEIWANKAESDNKFNKAALLSVTADFIRLTNDILALYNLCQKDDKSFYKWNKVMWVGQDLKSFFDKMKWMNSNDSEENEEFSSEEEQRINLMLSDFSKKLDLYVLPTVEGIAAFALSLNGIAYDFNERLSLALQSIISGSRLLAEAIESKHASVDQKLLITKAVIHSVLVLADIIRSYGMHKKAAPVNPSEEPEGGYVLQDTGAAPQETHPNVQPSVTSELEVPEHGRKRRASVGRKELEGLIRYLPEGDLGRIPVRNQDGTVRMCSARFGIAPEHLIIKSDE